MIFATLLGISAASIAFASAFFSIFGLTKLFAATSVISIIIMGASLEAGKLMAISFLYRYYTCISIIFKILLIISIIILMTITSLGIFGYLTEAYQAQSAPVLIVNTQLNMAKITLKSYITRRNSINNQISQLPNNYVTARQRLLKTYSGTLEKLNTKIPQLRKEILSLVNSKSTNEVKLGPIFYVARTLNLDPSIVVFWFVLLIIFVFDPLAVMLTVAVNVVIGKKLNMSIPKNITKTLNHIHSKPIKRDALINKIQQEISNTSSLT